MKPVEFRIADTFLDSLARLMEEERKLVKTTVFDLQVNPLSPGMAFHRLDKARDKGFWSVRVGRDLRLIVHRSEPTLLVCYVDHHDKAYEWAERRRIEVHPHTLAAQLVEVRRTTREVVVPAYVPQDAPHPARSAGTLRPLFGGVSEKELLSYGVPQEWVGEVRGATEETLLSLAEHLPGEAAEALLELATGGKPRLPRRAATEEDPFDHPDAQRRFRVVSSVEELARALDYPWEKWTVFLHPEQREWVEREYTGPARVSGSAGTGKTIVALHRAVHLARTHPDARVLLATYSDTLASALRTKLRRLLTGEPRLGERIDVHSLRSIGMHLHAMHLGPAVVAPPEVVRELLRDAASSMEGHRFSKSFLHSEWDHVVDAWQLATWEQYRDVRRLGRKTRFAESRRAALWSIFEQVRAGLEKRGLVTESGVFTRLADVLRRSEKVLFDFAVVDEAQDIGVSHIRFFAALGGERPNALFFAGDLGQRIFQQPFSWRSLGVDIRGRSRTLRVNYRTSHQIRIHADRLLGPVAGDVDVDGEERVDAVSVFNGPDPSIRVLAGEDEEIAQVGVWIADLSKGGVLPQEAAVIVRSAAELERAERAVQRSGLAHKVLDRNVETAAGHVSICTMHLAKGLEFRAVAVMACDDEVVPLQSRIEGVGDEGDLQEVYDTERHLLYVACTRARDYLLVTGVKPGSEFLDDFARRKGPESQGRKSG